jgi:hypothetical protein
MVPLVRLERTTRGLGNRCSIHLSYRGLKLNHVVYYSVDEGTYFFDLQYLK